MIRARAEICVLRAMLSAEMACGACAVNVRCLELDRVCMCIDLVLSSSIDDTVSFYGDSDVLAPSLFPVAPVTFGDAPPPDVSDIAVIVGTTARARLSRERVPHAFTLPRG